MIKKNIDQRIRYVNLIIVEMKSCERLQVKMIYIYIYIYIYEKVYHSSIILTFIKMITN